MLSKFNTRFENVCKTNGYVTRLTAQAAALYPYPEAEALMRYTNGIMHIYYYLMSPGGMSEDKWAQMVSRGILTREEVQGLQRQGSPGVVLYSWAVDILKTGVRETTASTLELQNSLTQVNMWATGLIPMQLNMEACIGGTRGLAAKQIAYTIQQPPMIYFHAVYVCTHAYLLCSVWQAGHTLGEAAHNSCEHLYPPISGEEEAGGGQGGSCKNACASIVLMQHVMIFCFLVLLKSAEHLSDAYGNKPYSADLGVDLDNLWQESINVLKSMSVPRPKLKRP